MVLLEPLSYQPVSGGPVIFLAGPVTAAPPWQTHAFELIQKLDPGVLVASPRRFHIPRQGRFRATGTLRTFPRQRAWERHYMDLAGLQGCVLFWLAAPRESVEGLPYAANTRYELGLWSARWVHNRRLGVCVGGDPSFPTLQTLVYDLGKDLPGRKLHRSLEDAVQEAVSIARANYKRWVEAGSPDIQLESELETVAHEEKALAQTVLAHQPGDPVGRPEILRLQALRLLKAIPDLCTPDRLDASETSAPGDLEELEELEDGEELEELEAVEDSDESVPPADPRRVGMLRGMKEAGSWFLAGRLVQGPKYLAVGRSTYYISFLQRLSEELGDPVYQSDYMEWPMPENPYVSLSFYIETAERVDINLEGIKPEDLKTATANSAGPSKALCPEIPFMTLWEINRLYWKQPKGVVFWHTGGTLTHEEAFRILGGRVSREFIIED